MPKSKPLWVFHSPGRVRVAARFSAASVLACVLVFSSVVSAATSATRGVPGTWSLAASGIRTVAGQIGTARTPDGVLHVIWSRGGAGTPWALLETTVTPLGKVSAAATIISGWSRIDDVDATFVPGKPLTIAFTGTKTDTTGDPTDGLNVATKAGGRWTVGAAAVYRTDLAGSSVPAIGYSNKGTLIEAWSAGGKITVHAGSDPAKPATSFGERGGNVVLPQQPGIDRTMKQDVAVIGWCGEAGIFWGSVRDDTPALSGEVIPGSSTTRCPAAARTSLIWGRGAGIYAAASIASERKVLVWRSGGYEPLTAAGGAGIKQQVALGSDRKGRVWIGWRDTDSNTLRLRRSNRSANEFGAVVSTKLPPSQDSLYQLSLDGQDDRVDVIARTTKGSAVSLFHTQMWPGLSVEAITKTGLVTVTVTVAVTDAGEPVPGASVRIGNHSLHTNQRGEASLELSPGSYRVVASKPKYIGANTRVRVKSG